MSQIEQMAEQWQKRVKKGIDGNQHKRPYGRTKKIRTIGWNADGRKIASGSTDAYVRVYNLATDSNGESPLELRGHTGDIDQITWHPSQPELIASTGNDKTVRLWDTRKSGTAQVIETKAGNINMAWHPDGVILGVGDQNDTINFIDIRGGSGSEGAKIVRKLERDGETNEFSWNYAGNLLYIAKGADLRGSVEILPYPLLNTAETVEAHTASCYCIDFDPRGRYWATGSADSVIGLWDLEESICVRTFAKGEFEGPGRTSLTNPIVYSEPIQSLGFSHDGELLAVGSPDKPVYIIHADSGQYVGSIDTFGGTTNTVAWHPTKHTLAYAAVKTEGNIHLLSIPSST
ncbi:hypothetical protein SmJEL517_g03789 [Synchytrium microbalum]|uniref:Uncharacterized protein n=1 Tax=Synchytrium microbalum TaxID=1806994 RepID=A0A507C5U6_9FUNG|nr:uncharacterized protein SmJEL517_g03789 [Synchytrium microbalum]TPX33346.1 hypothetical protein SmJEL517_g03789 [Synchytrium microbalum]